MILSKLAGQTGQLTNRMYLFEDLFLQVHDDDACHLRIYQFKLQVRKITGILCTY